MVPSASDAIQGCPIAPRCPHVMDICRQHRPPLDEIEQGHFAACWLHGKSIPQEVSSIAQTAQPA
jgi:oligopeptide/dipeptide ABC transporter ATP-binding protein